MERNFFTALSLKKQNAKTSKDEENSINVVVGCDGCIAGKLRKMCIRDRSHSDVGAENRSRQLFNKNTGLCEI